MVVEERRRAVVVVVVMVVKRKRISTMFQEEGLPILIAPVDGRPITSSS